MALFKWKRNPYRPTSARQHLTYALLGVGAAVVVAFLVLDPIARLQRMNRPPPDAAPCTARLQTGCVGGKLEVLLVVPPSTTAGTASSAASTTPAAAGGSAAAPKPSTR